MITLSPKKAFQENEDAVRSFRAIVDSNHFRFAATQAVAEFTLNSRPTTDELSGARKFLDVLLNMAETEAPAPQFPHRRLAVIEDSRTVKPKTPEPPK